MDQSSNSNLNEVGAARLILGGWRLVTSGPAVGGDKYWDMERRAWMPLTVNRFTDVDEYVAVIRKGEL